MDVSMPLPLLEVSYHGATVCQAACIQCVQASKNVTYFVWKNFGTKDLLLKVGSLLSIYLKF